MMMTSVVKGLLLISAFCQGLAELDIIDRMGKGAGCGRQTIAPNISAAANVMGGSFAVPGSWPWVVQLHLQWNATNRLLLCGGSLITPSWVATAAHCIVMAEQHKMNMSSLSVSVGVSKRENPRAEFLHTSLVAKYIVNPIFSMTFSGKGDLALLRLSSPVPLPFNSHTNTLCLPPNDPGFPTVGADCVVAGWGDEVPLVGPVTPVFPATLMQLRMPVLAIQSCTKLHPSLLKENAICSGYPMGVPGVCNGDSGGPLMCRRGPGGPWVLGGIVSFGQPGCGGGPDVFTRVSHFLPWIHRNIH